jgi:YegS/Rv2252/BmrU family lipid kinase
MINANRRRSTRAGFHSTSGMKTKSFRVRICVIFNPAARGNKARRFRRFLDELSQQCALKATNAPGDARRLAQAAAATGYDIIAAAGGDGTVNEVLNGIGDEPDGFSRVRLGVLPLGTVNVFARELNIPLRLEGAWKVLKRAQEMKIDLGRADYFENGRPQRRFFMQLGGAGLDARAIELVSWKLKKSAGPLAYVVAGFQALAEKQAQISVSADGKKICGELALLGNGKLYGGPFDLFPEADLRDGRLDACVFPRVNLPSLLKLAPGFMARRKLSEHRVLRLQAQTIELTSDSPAAFELDGEWAGTLPATFSVEREKLRVVVP